MLPKWQTGVVRQVAQLTHNVRHYWLELPETQDFAFQPGQFVTFDLPIHEQRNKRWRSYSIASMPNGTNVIELTIAFVTGGLASEYIFNTIKEGSEILLRGPHGVFVLPQVVDQDIFMICTGTGVAPYRSMLQYIQAHNLPHKNVHLIFGTRYKSDLLFEAEMRAFTKTIPDFYYHPTLSREKWEGATGYVHPIYEALCAGHPDAMFMLCGQHIMIEEARQRIAAMGYPTKNVHIEIYG